MSRFISTAALALLLSTNLWAQDQDATEEASEQESNTVTVILHTSMGDITLALDPDKAPISVDNFVQYVNDGFYDGTIFHRVIGNFMIQGGGFTTDVQKQDTRGAIKNESDNGLSNTRGTISMARLTPPDTATAQFFINVNDNTRLDFVNAAGTPKWGYAVFGHVTDGMDVVDAIKSVPTGAMGPFSTDAPQKLVIIETAEVVD
jgi:peptidyl-prolyl cis-trans isomerase A (cyclophilin A)